MNTFHFYKFLVCHAVFRSLSLSLPFILPLAKCIPVFFILCCQYIWHIQYGPKLVSICLYSIESVDQFRLIRLVKRARDAMCLSGVQLANACWFLVRSRKHSRFANSYFDVIRGRETIVSIHISYTFYMHAWVDELGIFSSGVCVCPVPCPGYFICFTKAKKLCALNSNFESINQTLAYSRVHWYILLEEWWTFNTLNTFFIFTHSHPFRFGGWNMHRILEIA